MYHQIILSFIISCISLLALRGYDKFNNKQYTKQVYINQFFLILSSSLIVLYIDNHLNNSNLLDTSTIKMNQSGGSSLNTKGKSVINSNLENIKMNFNTGIPNF